MSELVFVKLGGSLITDKSKPRTARRDVILRLGREIAAARGAGDLRVLVGHGGGSFPHVSAKEYRTHEGIVDDRSWEGFVRVHDDARALNDVVCACLTEAGLPAYSVQPSACAVAHSGRIVTWPARPVELLLEAGLVPVPYGDVCLDEAQGCCIISTEEILRHLGSELAPARIVLAGKVDGVFDETGALIPAITPANLDSFRSALLGSDGVADVTGGMLQKVEHALEMGLPVQVVNGLTPGRLESALRAEKVPGTLIHGR